MIHALLSQNFDAKIYALFLQFFSEWKADPANFFAFRMDGARWEVARQVIVSSPPITLFTFFLSHFFLLWRLHFTSPNLFAPFYIKPIEQKSRGAPNPTSSFAMGSALLGASLTFPSLTIIIIVVVSVVICISTFVGFIILITHIVMFWCWHIVISYQSSMGIQQIELIWKLIHLIFTDEWVMKY